MFIHYVSKRQVFALKDILERETDGTHGITMGRILELLEMQGIQVERKSIYDDLHAFEECGIDVTRPQGKDREYSLASRTIEPPEIKMIGTCFDNDIHVKGIFHHPSYQKQGETSANLRNLNAYIEAYKGSGCYRE